MLKLAWQMLRSRSTGAVATLVALTVGVTILMACGLLLESGLRYQARPDRYAAADIVVGQPNLTVTSTDVTGESMTTTLVPSERVGVPARLVDAVAAVAGVASAAGDRTIPVVSADAPTAATVGHGWDSVAVTGTRLVAGTPPRADDEVALDANLAATLGVTAGGGELTPGARIRLIVGGAEGGYRVSGLVTASGAEPAAAYFTETRAAQLTPRQDRVDAVLVGIDPGADRTAVTAAVRKVAQGAGADVFTGAERGVPEQPGIAAGRSLVVTAAGSFGGYVAMLVVIVVAGTVGLSVRHRRRDLALLRAVAATPGQVRRLVLAEVMLVTAVAAVIGLPAGLLAGRWTRDQMVERGFVPDSFTVQGGALAALAVTATVGLVAAAAALLAGRRTARIRPTEALGETAVEPARSGRFRIWSGLACVAGGLALTTVTTTTSGIAAIGAATGMLYTFVIGVALLAPSINNISARVLAPVLRRVWGVSGYLAAANLRANARGSVPVLVSLVLAVGLGGSVWFLQDNLQRQTVAQKQAGTLARHVLVSPPAGLPPAAAERARQLPGVVAATGVVRTTVIVPILDGVEPVPAQGIDPDGASQTLDLRIRSGSMADLKGAAVAVSRTQAASAGWKVGEAVSIWLGDGTPERLRVVAIYDRGLGFGDITLPRETLAGHTSTDRDDEVLVQTKPGTDIDAALTEFARSYPGAYVTDAAGTSATLGTDLAVGAWLNKLLIGVMVGYAALAAGNSMVMAALARGRELSLLRLVGVTRRQARRMVNAEQVGLLGVALAIGGAIAAVTLSSIVHAISGQFVPYVPPMGYAAILGGATLLAMVAAVLPVNRLLGAAPTAAMGVKE